MGRIAKDFTIRKWKWAKSNPLFWSNITLILLIIGVILHPGSTDLRVRILAMLLQLIGVYTVWHDLASAAREFKATGIVRRNWQWLKSGLGFKTRRHVSSSFRLDNIIYPRFDRVCVDIDDKKTINERVAQLEKLIQLLDQAHINTKTESFETEVRIARKIQALRDEASKSETDINIRLKNAAVGNYPTLLFGAIWLAIGIILSSTAPEVFYNLARNS